MSNTLQKIPVPDPSAFDPPVQVPLFHPSSFEHNLPNQGRNIDLLQKERATKLPKGLVSPGMNTLTNVPWYDKTNTKSLFKRLHGETLLTELFFSHENMTNIQNVVRMIVFRETDYIVDYQSTEEVLIVMRSVFLQYSAHPPLLDDSQSPEVQRRIKMAITKEIRRLNDIVITEMTPRVITGLKQYVKYLQDASEPYAIMDAPINDNIRGQRQLRSVTSVLTGDNL